MKIRPKIPMLLGGNNIWYNGILDYDPARYTHAYDTSRLVNPLNFGEAWASRANGLGRGRYIPNPSLSRELIDNIEKNNSYYKQFTKDLFNPNGTLSEVGKAYARLSDNLLPENSLARVYNGNLMRTNWTTTNNDTYGRPGNSFNNIKDYLWYERNDNLPGGRHNVFLNKGKRYFYVDNNGNYHWVSPEDAAKYNISEKPVEYGWGDDNVYWEDYEITGPKNPLSQLSNPTGSINAREYPNLDKLAFLKNLGTGLKKVAPDILEGIRFAGNLINNDRVYKETLKGIRPNLLLSYLTHRQVVGDEATKLAYYRRGAEGITRASRPFTSDADRLMAYQMEAQRVANELRALGDLADNLEIRRTSDESNLHQWANTLRNTEVANRNLIELNNANAAKQNLKALKSSADWSNLDNYLMGIQSKFERERSKLEAILDLIDLLTMLDNLAEDSNYKKAYNELTEAAKLYNNDWSNPNLAPYILALKKAKTQYLINYYRTRSAKSGTKLTYESNNKYLYKTAKDVVEHFRKMSKMSDDSRLKSRTKPIKLSSHPKGNTRKYQQGGVAPFTIYRPLGMSDLSLSSQVSNSGNSSKSSKSDPNKDKLDMIKELFKAIQGLGLPIDVSMVYNDLNNLFARYKAFGEEMSTEDIASMYLSSMKKINDLKFSKDIYDKAMSQAASNEALNEFAVGVNGEMVLLNVDTAEVKIGTIKDYLNSKGKLNPLTNNQLLGLRAHSPNMAFRDTLMEIVNNGVGMNKIAALIKNLAGNLGSTKEKLEGVSEVESNRIKAGLRILSGTSGTPDGYYKVSQNTEESLQQMKAAIKYIEGMLPKNYKVLLELNSNGNSENLIASYLLSQNNSTFELSILPLTGKASDKDGKDSGEKVTATFNDLIQRQQVGIPREFSMITKGENTKLYSFDAKYVPTLNKVNGDMSILKMLATSEIGNILDSRLGITFGDQVINPDNLKDIMFSVGGGATFVTLPCKYENGHKVVNFAIKDDFDEAIKEASKTTPIDWTNRKFTLNLANILKKKGLDSLLTGNMELDPNMLGLFMVVEGYTTDRVKFNKNSKYIEKVSNPDKELENRLNNALSTKGADGKVQNYGVDINDWGIGPLFEGGWDDIYHGSVFIPLNNDPISAQIGQSNLNRAEARLLASEYQNYQKLIKANKNNLLYEVE